MGGSSRGAHRFCAQARARTEGKINAASLWGVHDGSPRNAGRRRGLSVRSNLMLKKRRVATRSLETRIFHGQTEHETRKINTHPVGIDFVFLSVNL